MVVRETIDLVDKDIKLDIPVDAVRLLHGQVQLVEGLRVVGLEAQAPTQTKVERHTDRKRDRGTDADTGTDTSTSTNTGTEREREKEKEREREREREKERERERHPYNERASIQNKSRKGAICSTG